MPNTTPLLPADAGIYIYIPNCQFNSRDVKFPGLTGLTHDCERILNFMNGMLENAEFLLNFLCKDMCACVFVQRSRCPGFNFVHMKHIICSVERHHSTSCRSLVQEAAQEVI